MIDPHDYVRPVAWTLQDDRPWRTLLYERPFTREGNYLVGLTLAGNGHVLFPVGHSWKERVKNAFDRNCIVCPPPKAHTHPQSISREAKMGSKMGNNFLQSHYVY